MSGSTNVISSRKWLIGLVTLFGLLTIGMGNLVFAQENVITVNSFTDTSKKNDGTCTLREAVIAANKDKPSGGKKGECRSGNGADVIELPAGTYTLSRSDNGNENSSSTGDLDIASDITIRPAEATGVVLISGGGISDRVFHILSNEVLLERLTIRDGRASTYGGGVFNEGGNVTLVNVTLTENQAGTAGGALRSNATTLLNHVTIVNNSAPAGSGLAVGSGNLTVQNTLVADDSCSGAITPGGENLTFNTSGCSALSTVSGDPQLTTVSAGGLDTYFVPAQASPSVNSADNAFCADTDQIGLDRSKGGAVCDIGAIELEEVNQPPDAVDDLNVTLLEDTAVDINAAGNDSDPDNNLLLSSISIVSGPGAGSAVPTSGQDGYITYTPATHYDGPDSFDYQICDSEGLCDTASVSITVTPDAFIEVTNVCDSGSGSLRSAINDANGASTIDTIVFDIFDTSCGSDTINLITALPSLGEPVIIDGLATDGNFSLPGSEPYDPYIALDGACADFSGITILSSGGGSTIANLILNDFGGSGIFVGDLGAPSDGNSIVGNTIANSGCAVPADVTSPNGVPANDGVTVFGVNNQIQDNNIFGNEDLNVDLGGDGTTANDPGDGDAGANDVQNYPWLLSATPAGEINAILNSIPSSSFTVEFFVSQSCDGDESLRLSVSPMQFNTDGDGNVLVSTTVQAPDSLNYGQFVISTATDSQGNTSEYSNCIPVDDDNSVWPNAWEIESGDQVSQKIISLGQSRWYKFWVSPNSKVKLSLDDLPENYDLVYFGNIGQAYAELIGNANPNMNRMDAEFSTDAFAPAVFNPAVFNPAQFNPAQFNPAQFNPAVFNPAVFNPAVFNPAIFSADVYSPAVFNPAQFNPAQFNPAQFNPAQFNPAVFNGNAYSAAQMSSLISASGQEGQAPEEISINSYNGSGWYYARVRGRQGAYDPDVDFTLGLTIEGGICEGIVEDFGNSSSPAVAGGYETVILVDWDRMGLDNPADPDRIALANKLNSLAGAASVNGVVIDVGDSTAYPEVAARNAQADQFNEITEVGYRLCPYAKNIVADGIKEIVDAYRDVNPINYVVIVGNDDAIPFYRIADQALLGPEEDYVVPVDHNSASEASLRNNYFLSQDGYGSKLGLAVKDETMPLPDKAVGRLVETPEQIMNMIDVYLANPVLSPQNALVTAYDFLTDGGIDVRDDLAASLGGGNVNDDLLVANPETWTAAELDNALDTYDFDIAFLSGHFSATGALAADYATGYFTDDFLASPLDLSGALLYSAGCHSGYNIVNDHAIPDYTPDNVTDPDWAAAMAQKGVTFIGGTGYQYGDTDIAEYSERLYHEFTRQLRSDVSTNVAVGDALTAAKQQYLIDTPSLTGIHQKALLEATLFGLPMAGVNMPGARLDLSTGSGSLVSGNLSPADNLAVAGDAGEIFGLQFYDLIRNYNLNEITKTFTSVDDENTTVDVSYLENGPGGIVSNAAEPTLPLDTFNATITDAPNQVLRSVGFLGGDYRDFATRFPLVGAPTTEVSAVHFSFLSFVYYPQQPWRINRFEALADSGGSTFLNLFPAQYQTEQSVSPQPPATQRQFDNMELRLFYLADNFITFAESNGVDFGTNRPDLAAAPTIVTVVGNPVHNGVDFDVEFEVLVVGDPSAGMQDVWISYTNSSSPSNVGNAGSWQSLFLTQDAVDSSLWRGTLSGISDPLDVRFIAQAVSGTGLVTMSNNLGRFYIPGVTGTPTALVEQSGPVPRQGALGTSVQFSALLTSGGAALPNMPVLFGIGQDLRLGWTGADGVADVDIPLLGTPPGEYEVTISFPGTVAYAPSVADTNPFTVLVQDTTLTLDPAVVTISSLQPDVALFATLTDSTGRPLAEKTATFTVSDGGGFELQKAVITDQQGRARLGLIELPALVDYTVQARFEGSSSYDPSVTAGFSTLKFNNAPLCDNVVVQTNNGKDVLWPANNKMNGIELSGATDPDGDALTYHFLEIYQDEQVGGDLDGSISNSCSEAEVRSQRDGSGDGRVYHVFYQVVDSWGATCSGETTIATIPHDNGSNGGIDGGALFNSLGNNVPACSP